MLGKGERPSMPSDLIKDLVDATVVTVREHAQELTDLDRAIGDGDHGVNMKRGFEAIQEIKDELAGMEFGPALNKAGMTLVMKVGGASGPLYGSLFMGIGKAGDTVPSDVTEIAQRLEQGVEAVKKRGKSTAGEKTMLDVLVPVLEILKSGDDSLATVRASAEGGLAATRDMRATKGRASFLGERSVGHLDPGARSSTLLVQAVCDVIEKA